MAAIHAATCVLLSMSVAGCSFLFSKPPRDDYRRGDDSECSGYVLPVLDTIWAGLNGIGALQAASSNDASWKQQQQAYPRSTVMTVGFAWLVVSGASAIYGYRNGAACAEVQEEAAAKEERRRYLRSSPMPYRPAAPMASPPGAASPPAPGGAVRPANLPPPEQADPFQ